MTAHAAWIALGGVALAIWLYVFLARGFFWILRPDRRDFAAPSNPANLPRIAAVIPARNESATIRACLASVLRQDYGGELSVIVVDDHSTDETAELGRAVAVPSRRNLDVISAAPLPDGWTGKLWALQEGVQHAGNMRPDYFWFTDADITHAPDTLSALVARAEHQAEDQRLELVSLIVRLRCDSFAERLLIPAFLYFFLMLYPPRWTADARTRTAGAAGGCILLRSDALERIGGLAPIRWEVIDDCALARAVKRSGGNIWMGVTRRNASLRGYSGFAELLEMVARTAFTQLRYSALALVGAMAALLITYGAPVAALFSRDAAATLLGCAALLLMTISYAPALRFFELSPYRAPLLPVAAAWYAFAACISAARYWRGRGGRWKGRAQAPRPRGETRS
jgi:hopene-associated glycosyltransferase HpnB